MTDLLLKELDVTDFRSIRGRVHAPLDAQVVLIHGENGAGKTSLLSAIELALTGGVQSLRRADPDYASQLMHRSAARGNVSVATVGTGAATYGATLSRDGIATSNSLDATLASFFSERSYLPQALLGQLLQIYQDSGSGANSPLAKFVGELLRLDRLDAIEAGLKPLGDVRNVRKVVDGWSDNELEKTRLDALIKDQKLSLLQIIEDIGFQMSAIEKAADALGLVVNLDDRKLDAIEQALLPADDEQRLAVIIDRRRELGSIRRDLVRAAGAGPSASFTAESSSDVYERWAATYLERYSALRSKIEAILPATPMPGDMAAFGDAAIRHLTLHADQATSRANKAKTDAERLATAESEIEVARSRLKAISGEMAGTSTSAGGLAAILSEVTAFIDGETCPVCDRDYAELNAGTLVEHVHGKVRRLSASAQRLLELGRMNTQAQALVDRLEREIATLIDAIPDERTLAELDRAAADSNSARAELADILDALKEGSRLRAAQVAAQRAVTEAQSRSVALTAARQTLSDFAVAVATPPIADGEDLSVAAERVQALLDAENATLEVRLSLRREGRSAVATIRSLQSRADRLSDELKQHEATLKIVTGAQQRAQKVRVQGTKIRDAVDAIRSSIIRRAFNERLNRLWRDLFVRLAPGEPFIPAFRIPEAATQRIQPRLVTDHRAGGAAGGTPGAMLSAGNLNTAALTLFLSLHLSVPKTLPWLILDDPVQSMDDVHIAHLAALLRTLSKEHGRQIVIAVHDRQLFEYLRLELSPAFPNDSLLTLELARGPHQDTRCLSRRYSFREETSLLAA
ncbi:AAA family ATPase [Sphingomonas yunnanensis]|uniref:AAA family ATPase n=1 Tax=Sphingomonas yunnanensis TaxID=310400 RepID=UPI001CA6E46E|nr:AAA family ATPase [Sphingomonas yunnanensis]MBY9061330.1 AAA family ATPase [Sphingomonas yunnanensis]